MDTKILEKLHKMYDDIEIQYRPDLRWWLAEGLNTDETLKKNVQQIYDSGFGAAEFLAMPEPGADSAVYGWGSPEWTSDTRLIIEEATRLGLGFSFTSGANWANANLPDTYVWKGKPYNPDNPAAAKELDYATVLVKVGETFKGLLPHPVKVASVQGDIHGTAASYREHTFQGLVAAKVTEPRKESGQDYDLAQGSGTGALQADTLIDLTSLVQVEGDQYRIEWEAPADGQYALFIYWMHGTSQTASPSVSTNYTVNYVDSYGIEAMIDYWEEIVLNDQLKETIRKNGRGEIYMDSLEIVTYGAGGLLWGYHLKEEFEKRKGYDITRYLPFITMDGVRIDSKASKKYDYQPDRQDDMADVEKVRMDFYSVVSDMYVEYVLKPLQAWLHSLNMTLRAEPSYGMTYEISTPARYIDGIETESFAQVADIDLYRGISGSANMYGRIFSSETGAVPRRNYYYNMDQWTQLCYLQFATGVNRTVFHGYSAIEGSEADTYWPGHEGMYAVFSERFNSRQPASIHYPGWTKMLSRNQKILRQGVARRDIAILRTDYFFINYGQPEGYDTFTSNYSMHDIPYFWNDMTLQRAGYNYDYFSPLLLEDEENVTWTNQALQPNGPAYRAIIIYQEGLELSSAEKIYEITKDGIPVIFVNNNTEILAHDGAKIEHKKAASVSKYLNDSDEELRKIVQKMKALPNVREVDSPEKAKEVLGELGVRPRVAYAEPNNKILTASRWDEENKIFYVFAYSYKFEVEKDSGPYSFVMEIEGEGVPYEINDWTGEITGLGLYERKDGVNRIPLTMQPGEARIIAQDFGQPDQLHVVSTTADEVTSVSGKLQVKAVKSGVYQVDLSDGKNVEINLEVPEAIFLKTWDVVIEDWNEGEKVVNTEEKFDHITKEVYYTTKKTPLEFKNSSLVPWKDLLADDSQLALLAGEGPSMAQVSGVGNYTASFVLDENWSDANGAYLDIESAGGGTVEVYVNGRKAPGIDLRTLKLDITRLLKRGENTIRIEVTSTLTNRMIQRNYKDKKSGWSDVFPKVQAYGLSGEVRIVPYTMKTVL